MNNRYKNNPIYIQGLRDGLQSYGTLCAAHGDCGECPIARKLGDMDCEVCMRRDPAKLVDAIAVAEETPLNYYEQYCLRFPESVLTLEEVSDSVCRKMLFTGDMTCSGGDCLRCWSEPYKED